MLQGGENYNSPFRRKHTVTGSVNGKEVFYKEVYLPHKPKKVLDQYEKDLRRSLYWLTRQDKISFTVK